MHLPFLCFVSSIDHFRNTDGTWNATKTCGLIRVYSFKQTSYILCVSIPLKENTAFLGLIQEGGYYSFAVMRF
jgi:hypothetical protein